MYGMLDQARDEGIGIGIERGVLIGRKEGEKLGREKTARKNLISFLKNTDVTLEQLSLVLGVPFDEVVKLAKRYRKAAKA